ncbi:hypothetical protein [Pseudoclavibacter sp. JSM 162008]|uniref:hypothetical protein n=1 Tax=Pseudoclavibacter sp. JSM 162008 TaxID=3229855 RepID=UPI00352527B5
MTLPAPALAPSGAGTPPPAPAIIPATAVEAEPKAAVDYVAVVENHFLNRPRNLQVKVGPSGLGHPCNSNVLCSLAGVREPNRGMNWKADIGTAMHAELESAFEAWNQTHGHRWVTEWPVTVGVVGGAPITGSLDLYDTATNTVIDHKLVGSNTLAKYRKNGPSDIYKAQINLYAMGLLIDGGWGTPERVQISFLPREEEWSRRFIWNQPVDFALAAATLARANQLATLLASVGLDEALARQGVCDDQWCWVCKPLHRDAKQSTRKNLFT